jgi:phospholipase/carboxylesterase
MPSSRERTWDIVVTGRYGADVTFIDSALASVFATCNIDPMRLAIGGFSDGASYALSLGVSNGDLFTALLGYSPGFWIPGEHRGRPRAFVSHGDNDAILPVTNTRENIVKGMRSAGYTVTYQAFSGGHTLTSAIYEQGMNWFLSPA